MSDVRSVVIFLPHLSARSPTRKPQNIGGKNVIDAIQEMCSSVILSGAGPFSSWSIGVIGDCQPINMPKFKTGIVTENRNNIEIILELKMPILRINYSGNWNNKFEGAIKRSSFVFRNAKR